MTVNYGLVVANASPTNRLKLLFRWKGSIWKAIISDFLVWSSLFILISLCLNYLPIDKETKIWLSKMANSLDKKTEMKALSFILSFFVTAIITRWTYIIANIGMIDSLALSVAFNIHGNSEFARMIRRNIVRYAVQAQLLVFRDISIQVQKRFPKLNTMVQANFMSQDEFETYFCYDPSNNYDKKYWMPINWAQKAIHRAKEEGMIGSDIQYLELNKTMLEWRNRLSEVAKTDWVPIPLVYPQLVVLAVHTYFIILLFSRQAIFIDPKDQDTNDPYKDHQEILMATQCLLTILEFIFYVGWLRVAEALLNPMGEDDDDFEMNWLLDRNLMVGLSIVDGGMEYCPILEKDLHWDGEKPLLYSENSRQSHPLQGSVMNLSTVLEEEIEAQLDVRMVVRDEDLGDRSRSRRASKRRLPAINHLESGPGPVTFGSCPRLTKSLRQRVFSEMGNTKSFDGQNGLKIEETNRNRLSVPEEIYGKLADERSVDQIHANMTNRRSMMMAKSSTLDDIKEENPNNHQAENKEEI